jgi:hypothetical protein
MTARKDPWEQARDAFSFLLHEWGFDGPERFEDGMAFHRPDLHVSIEVWSWKNESGFMTTLSTGADAEGVQRSASLACLYLACELGPAQDVPEGASTQHAITKRVVQHAEALRLLMPHISDPARFRELLDRCG